MTRVPIRLAKGYTHTQLGDFLSYNGSIPFTRSNQISVSRPENFEGGFFVPGIWVPGHLPVEHQTACFPPPCLNDMQRDTFLWFE